MVRHGDKWFTSGMPSPRPRRYSPDRGTDRRNSPSPERIPASRDMSAFENANLDMQLFKAISRGADANKVRLLIDEGADVNYVGAGGVSVADSAVMVGVSPQVLHLLLTSGASIAPAGMPRGWTLLHTWSTALLPTERQRAEAWSKFRSLLEFSTDLGAQAGQHGDTALHLVARSCHRHGHQLATVGPGAFKYLQEYMEGCRFQYELLVNSKADPRARNRDRLIPLDLVEEPLRSQLKWLDP